MSFFEALRWSVTIVCPEDHVLADNELLEMFELRSSRTASNVRRFTGELDDLPDHTIARIPRGVKLHEEYMFYEFAFHAKTKMVNRDLAGALLFAVFALEGAHAAFLRRALSEHLPEDADKLSADLLRDAGLSNLHQLTPFILMEESERPSNQMLNDCARGITLRNEIVHSLTKRRRYKIRNRSSTDVSEAYSAVLKVYDCYVSALEKRLGSTDAQRLLS